MNVNTRTIEILVLLAQVNFCVAIVSLKQQSHNIVN